MSDTSVGRRDYLLLGGILAIVLFVASFIAFYSVGDVPDRDTAPAADFVRYFQEEDGSIWIGSLLMSLAAVAFLFYVGALRGALGSARLSGTILGGGIGVALLMLCGMAPGLAGAVLVADREEAIDPQVAMTLAFLGDGFIIAAFYAAAAFVAAVALAGLRTGALPRWLSWVGFAIAVLLAVPFIGFLAFVFVFPLWIIATTLALWSRPSLTAAPAM